LTVIEAATITMFQTVKVVSAQDPSTLVQIIPESFSDTATVRITETPFSLGSSKVRAGAKSRSSIMNFYSNKPAVKPILVSIAINEERRQSVGEGNFLFQHWLDKQTNEWIIICSESKYDIATGALQTMVPATVFNDPAFNPESGCAANYGGPCDGSGGKFTVFEVSASSCTVPGTGPSGGLEGGTIAGIIIGIVAVIIFVMGILRLSKNYRDNAKIQKDIVKSSLILGGGPDPICMDVTAGQWDHRMSPHVHVSSPSFEPFWPRPFYPSTEGGFCGADPFWPPIADGNVVVNGGAPPVPFFSV
jgi:hypothetical protein